MGRCWGCCQENCGFNPSCGCVCHAEEHVHEFKFLFGGGGYRFLQCKCGKMDKRREQLEVRGCRVVAGTVLGLLVTSCAGEIDSANPDCSSCGEETRVGECPDSRRTCGHHCNHSWSHDHCDWCGKHFACCDDCGVEMVLSNVAWEAAVADGGPVSCSDCLLAKGR